MCSKPLLRQQSITRREAIRIMTGIAELANLPFETCLFTVHGRRTWFNQTVLLEVLQPSEEGETTIRLLVGLQGSTLPTRECSAIRVELTLWPSQRTVGKAYYGSSCRARRGHGAGECRPWSQEQRR